MLIHGGVGFQLLIGQVVLSLTQTFPISKFADRGIAVSCGLVCTQVEDIEVLRLVLRLLKHLKSSDFWL